MTSPRSARLCAAGATALVRPDDERFFAARRAFGRVPCRDELPCLRKDFVVDSLPDSGGAGLGRRCGPADRGGGGAGGGDRAARRRGESGLDVLVEVHSEAELRWALAPVRRSSGSTTGSVRRSRSRSRRPSDRRPRAPRRVPGGGERHRAPADVAHAAGGAHAVLVGEAFMERPDPGPPWRSARVSVKVKICGVCTPRRARRGRRGPDFLGLNFWPAARASGTWHAPGRSRIRARDAARRRVRRCAA